jgi:hypothetical protein
VISPKEFFSLVEETKKLALKRHATRFSFGSSYSKRLVLLMGENKKMSYLWWGLRIEAWCIASCNYYFKIKIDHP